MSLSHEQKLAFIHKMTKLGMDHVKGYDGGGVISAGNSNPLTGISSALTAQNGYTAAAPTSAADIGGQQAGLAGELENEASGAGPNPAQIKYGQNAQTIAQNQAVTNAQNRALNPGLAARLSGTQAVAAGQSAAGGAAAQQAEQQLAAQGQLNQLTGTETQGLTNAQGINAQVSQNNSNAVNNTQGGLLSSIPVIGSIFAKGGMVKKMAKGGSVQTTGVANFDNSGDLPDISMGTPKPPSSGGSSTDASDNASLGANPFGIEGVLDTAVTPAMSAVPELGSGAGIGAPAAAPTLMEAAPLAAAALNKGGPVSHVGKYLFNGGSTSNKGKVPSMVSSGEKYLTPKQVKSVAEGKSNPMKVGKTVPGKPKVMRDSPKNDTVPAMLDEGGEVIPLHIMIKRNPEKAAAFVRKHLGKKAMDIA